MLRKKRPREYKPRLGEQEGLIRSFFVNPPPPLQSRKCTGDLDYQAQIGGGNSKMEVVCLLGTLQGQEYVLF